MAAQFINLNVIRSNISFANIIGVTSPIWIFLSGFLITRHLDIGTRGVYAEYQIIISSCAYWMTLGSHFTIPKYKHTFSIPIINTFIVISSLSAAFVSLFFTEFSSLIFFTVLTSTSVLLISTVYVTYTSTKIYFLSRGLSFFTHTLIILFLIILKKLTLSNILATMIFTNIIIISPYLWLEKKLLVGISELFFVIVSKWRYMFLNLQMWMMSTFDKFIFMIILPKSDLALYVVVLSIFQIPVSFCETLLPKLLNLTINGTKVPWKFLKYYSLFLIIGLIFITFFTNKLLALFYEEKYFANQNILIFFFFLVLFRSLLKVLQEPLRIKISAGKLFLINCLIVAQGLILIENNSYEDFLTQVIIILPIMSMCLITFLMLRLVR